MSIVRNPTQVSAGFSLKDDSSIPEIVEMLAVLVSQTSEAVQQRVSSVLAPFPYATGAMLSISSPARVVQQIVVSGTLGSSAGSSSFVLSSSKILPTDVTIISLYGIVQNANNAYPINFYDGVNSISSYIAISTEELVISYSSFFVNNPFNVVILYG